MPTPMAVLKGAQLLSVGAGKEKVRPPHCVDIGGATTDIHSIADGYPRVITLEEGAYRNPLPRERLKVTSVFVSML